MVVVEGNVMCEGLQCRGICDQMRARQREGELKIGLC